MPAKKKPTPEEKAKNEVEILKSIKNPILQFVAFLFYNKVSLCIIIIAAMITIAYITTGFNIDKSGHIHFWKPPETITHTENGTSLIPVGNSNMPVRRSMSFTNLRRR